MSNYLVSDTELTNIADVIRSKKSSGALIPFSQFANEINGLGEDLYSAHIPSELKEYEAFPDASSTIMQIYTNKSEILAVNNKSSKNFSMVDRTTGTATVLTLTPVSPTDATDVPQDMSEFYENGANIRCRSITENDDYYIVGMRHSSGEHVDGTHLYGGIAFVNKSTKTVTKCYWLPYIISRVKYDKQTGLLAVGLQTKGLIFYTISGTTLTEAETFLYDWSSGSPTNGRESQNGCFYTDNDGRRIYANVGFGSGVRFYNVTDSANITYISEFKINSVSELGSDTHTYSGLCSFPYLYLTIAPDDKDNIHTNLTGILTLNVLDASNVFVENYEYIKDTDGVVWNRGNDTKPTEMAMSQGMIYTNYEEGYLAFTIDPLGKKTHYCGKYLAPSHIYGVGADADSIFYVGVAHDNKAWVKMLATDWEWHVSSVLSHVSSSNVTDKIRPRVPYTTTLTPDTGYELTNVVVTMGGIDVTATAYDNGVVSISDVVGDLVITAVAVLPEPAYWKPSDTTWAQYSNSKPCTISATGENISAEISQGNSGFTATKNIETPTGNLKLKLIADTATVSEPTSTHVINMGVKFLNANNEKLKELNFFTNSSTKYVSDVVGGITLTFALADISTATQLVVTCRTTNSSDTSLFPATISFTNLRIELDN